MATDQPYDWRSARSRIAPKSTVEEMAAGGRRPSFGTERSGHPFIRGFRSRPGAPLAENDTLNGLGIAGEAGRSPERDAAWASFFPRPGSIPPAYRPPAATPPATTPGGYMGEDLSALPTPPQANLSAAIAGQSSWLTRNGLTPQPPSTIPPVGGSLSAAPVSSARHFRSRYGTASVSFQQPSYASHSNPWGKPIPNNG
jgi:hypothetical protein